MAVPETARPPAPAAGDDPHRRLMESMRHWWREMARDVDQEGVLDNIRAEAGLSARYLFMICMSAGIAILGLLLSSPAVVIGAMLLSPLMGPLMGAGFALAIGDLAWLRACTRTLFVGIAFAIVFCALIVVASPLQTVTEEIAARTRPNLFDLLVALFSALAGAYAMIRGREGTIVGVAIATALMPPLAVVGFGLATWNVTVFGGALMLFVTNLLTIALSAALMARYYGFHSALSERQSLLQSLGIAIAFVVLAIPLGLSLKQIAWESAASRQINAAIAQQFDRQARISQMDIDHDAEPIQVSASVLTPEFRPQAKTRAERALRRILGEPVAVTIDQFRVGTDPGAAETAQLARARAAEQAAATERQIQQLSDRLALVAGVSPDDVTIDRDRRRALVEARPLDGTTLAGYRALEQRVGGAMPDWTIRLRPPLRPLPDIAFAAGEPTDEGRDAVALVAWAAQRTGMAIELSGASGEVAAVREALAEQGVSRVTAGAGRAGRVAARWVAPVE